MYLAPIFSISANAFLKGVGVRGVKFEWECFGVAQGDSSPFLAACCFLVCCKGRVGFGVTKTSGLLHPHNLWEVIIPLFTGVDDRTSKDKLGLFKNWNKKKGRKMTIDALSSYKKDFTITELKTYFVIYWIITLFLEYFTVKPGITSNLQNFDSIKGNVTELFPCFLKKPFLSTKYSGF